MTDLDAAIRAKLEAWYDGHTIGSERMRDALLAVLDEHPLNDDHDCVEDIVGYSVQAWYRDKPCPTWLAIAKALGVETS